MTNEEKPKKVIWKRWWFWLFIVLVVVGAVFGSPDKKEKTAPKEAPEKVEETPKEIPEQVEEIAEIKEAVEKEVLEPEPETKTDRDKMIEIFKAEALADWSDDYRMVNYVVKEQIEAYDWVVKQTKYLDIMTKVKQEWGNDYRMVKYVYKKQVEAYEILFK